MENRKEYLNLLIKKLNIAFWMLFVFTVILAFREYQYLYVSAPSSGNWEIVPNTTAPNNYIYEWISYINIVLVVTTGILTYAIYSIKKSFEDIRKDIKS